jgi:hypothetical protein
MICKILDAFSEILTQGSSPDLATLKKVEEQVLPKSHKALSPFAFWGEDCAISSKTGILNIFRMR